MPISIKDAVEIIEGDIKEKYGKIVKFEISDAKYYSGLDDWLISGNFEYEITNKTLRVHFQYALKGKTIEDGEFST